MEGIRLLAARRGGRKLLINYIYIHDEYFPLRTSQRLTFHVEDELKSLFRPPESIVEELAPLLALLVHGEAVSVRRAERVRPETASKRVDCYLHKSLSSSLSVTENSC